MREDWFDVRKPGKKYYWYRALCSPIYENPKWTPIAINVLAENIREATEIARGYDSVTHRLKGIWHQGTPGDFYEYYARTQQAEMSEDDHQV